MGRRRCVTLISAREPGSFTIAPVDSVLPWRSDILLDPNDGVGRMGANPDGHLPTGCLHLM
eukprot:4870070-Amphidinium_carterae.1